MATSSPTALLLRERRFVLLASARTISVLGDGFARVALAFGVLAIPGSTPAQLSLVLACQAVPQLLLILVGGVLADRFSRSGLMVIADVLGTAAYGGLAVMLLTGDAPIPAVALLATLAGVATALFAPAMTGVVPEVVPRKRLQEANALLGVARNGAMVLGLALSGVVVALVGAGWALAFNAVSFLVSAALIRAMRLPRRLRVSAGSGWSDLRHGWREFVSHQWLWVVVLQYAFVVAAVGANVGVLGPLIAERDLDGASSWALIVAAQALGTVAGAGLAARLRPRRPMLLAVLATFPTALPMALLGAGAPLWTIVVAMFAAGVAGDVFGVLWTTTMQREVPPDALSRVSSYDWFGSLALAPLGILVAGPVAAAVGLGTALLGCSALVVAATLAALLSPQVRTLRAPVPEEEEAVRPAPGEDAGRTRTREGG
ncbi:MFS transporter [Streptosporangium oxazolinicum]|uniref:MFS transporter n=1 Tax=Streptosporangium oxazolinicum TaxID=909287 RepID=A0ABP8B306_9ACTN